MLHVHCISIILCTLHFVVVSISSLFVLHKSSHLIEFHNFSFIVDALDSKKQHIASPEKSMWKTCRRTRPSVHTVCSRDAFNFVI